MASKQHISEQHMGQIRNQQGNKKHLRTNESGNTIYQILGDNANQF